MIVVAAGVMTPLCVRMTPVAPSSDRGLGVRGRERPVLTLRLSQELGPRGRGQCYNGHCELWEHC